MQPLVTRGMSSNRLNWYMRTVCPAKGGFADRFSEGGAKPVGSFSREISIALGGRKYLDRVNE